MRSQAGDIRVALLGFGLAGRVFHAPLIATTPGLRLAAVVTRSPERAAQVTAEYPDVAVLPDLAAVWRAGVDLVVVATPNRTHVPLAREALRRGVAVVVDKPLAVRVADARSLVDDAAAAGAPLTVFHNRRWDGDFRTVLALLERDLIGRVTRFESRFERWRPEVQDRWRESGDPAEGGGLLLDLGSHLVDQALRLLGPVTEVYAEVRQVRAGALADDDAFLALRHDGGAVSHLWASAAAAVPAARFRVLGERGGYLKHGLDPQEDALRDGARPAPDVDWGVEDQAAWGRLRVGDREESVPTLPGAYPAFYAAVAEAVRSGGPMPVDPADAVAGLEILDAARLAAAERRVVTVAPAGPGDAFHPEAPGYGPGRPQPLDGASRGEP